MMKKYIFIAWIICTAFLGCSKNSNPDYFGTIKPTHKSDEVWINISTEPQYIDPTKIADNVSSGISMNMFLRLVQIQPKTAEIIPDLAKSWDISKNGLEYTFHMREDAVWSDGDPITAADVEYTWKRLSDSATGSTYSQMADVFQNGRAFREQAIQISGLTAIQDPKTLMKKLQSIAPIKDVISNKDLGCFFVFIESDDGQQKSAYRAKLLESIKNGLLGKNIKAAVTGSDVIQVKAKNSHTLWVRLEKSVPYFLGLIDYPVFAPVPKHVVEKFKSKGKEDQWVRPGNIVVSGPFILVEEQLKQYKVFNKNPKYFNASKVRINKVRTLMIEDYHADLNAYQTGQHDWSLGGSLPLDMVENLRKYKDYHHDAKLAVYYYQLNTTRKPLDDVRVRQALSLAIDRESLVKNITREGQLPIRDIVPDGIPGYKGPQSSVYEPEKAKKLLAEAGYPGGKGFPKLTLKFNTSEGHRKIAEAIQQMWKNVLGVQIDITNLEWRSMLEDQNRNNFDILRMTWNADYIDPHTFLSIFLSEGTNNHTFWKNKKYDSLIAASDQTLNRSDRFKLFAQAEKILTDEAPVIPVYGYVRSYMKKPYLRGFWPSIKDNHLWKYMWIDERWYKGVPQDLEISDEPWSN